MIAVSAALQKLKDEVRSVEFDPSADCSLTSCELLISAQRPRAGQKQTDWLEGAGIL